MHRHLSLVLAAAGSALVAQSNTVPGLDGKLEILDNLTAWGRRGPAYPGGEVGLSMRDTMCNPGTVNLPWFAAMSEDHPKVAFLIARLSGDRMVQISDWSYVKHAFTSASTNGGCGTCSAVTGTQLGVHCSDTYSNGNNGDRFWLGPPAEINPWLGTWNHIGSYFDTGDPMVGAPQNTDGVRSLSASQISAFDVVKNRVTVHEVDLTTPGASYFYAIQLVHQGEAVANRWDNLKSRGFTPTWSGSTWSVANSGVGETFGTVLQHWPGATVDVGQNGSFDGRFYVAVKVTPLGVGTYHYEYAVHNVDNDRGGAAFRVPIAVAAYASSFTFRDNDQNALNDWTAAKVGSEVIFTAPAGNPQNWNTIYNFGFDCDVAPGAAVCQIDEARIGPGALSVNVSTQAPTGAVAAAATPFGSGCGPVCPTSFYELFPTGAFDLANSSWTLTFTGSSYQLDPGTGTYQPPTGTVLSLTDDARVPVPLPFVFPYPGGGTTTLDVCSNGFVSAGNNGAAYVPSAAGLLAGLPRWAGLWHDFDPTSTASIQADVSSAGAVISYTAIPNYSGGGNATFQLQFLPTGEVHCIYLSVNQSGNDYLVGYSPGGGASDPGPVDLTTTIPAGLFLCGGAAPNLQLVSSARPILGTSINLTTSNAPVGTQLGMQVYSLEFFNPGVSLTPVGMPGCLLYEGIDWLDLFPVVGTVGHDTLAVPNAPGLAGMQLSTQAVTLSSGANPAGILITNAVALLVGVN